METPARNVSPYSRREKVLRVLWGVVQGTLFRWSLHPAYRFRAFLLRLFGARVGKNVRVRRSVRIEIPWNLQLGDDVSVGDGATLYCLGPVEIGARSFVSQYAHLCAGTHDYTSPDYPLLRLPIVLGEDVWVAADAFIGPGVTVGRGTVVGARASVFKDLPEWVVAVGNPAKPVKPRVLKGVSPGSEGADVASGTAG